MALKRKKQEKETVEIKKQKTKGRPNWLLRATILIVAIPMLILAIVLLTSMEKSGEPVEGSRFDHALDPKIEEKDLDALKQVLQYGNVDQIEVNLISATLRINIDTNDALDAASIEAIANDVYAQVDALLPITTYFTNKEDCKMYDLEINVYNLIPDESTPTAQLWCVVHKNASEEEKGIDWPTTPRNDEIVSQMQ